MVDDFQLQRERRRREARELPGGAWPSEQQEWLLKAALLRGDAAIEYYRRWRAAVDIDDVDNPSYRLLPLLAQNMTAHRVQDAALARMRGVYRLAWYKNNLIADKLAEVLAAFAEEGIQTLLLKGIPLMLSYYQDYGLRVMSDFDVLVPLEKGPEAKKLIFGAGWIPAPFTIAKDPFPHEYFSAAGYASGTGRNLDLHWYVTPESIEAGANRLFWEGAQPIAVKGVPTLTLNAADHIFHLCVHGLSWSPRPVIQWVADIATIMNGAGPEIEWGRVIEHAHNHRLGKTVLATLKYARELVAAPVPEEILLELERLPKSFIERLEYPLRFRRRGIFGELPTAALLYLRFVKGRSLWRRLAIAPQFFRVNVGEDYIRRVYKGARNLFGSKVRRLLRIPTGKPFFSS